MLVRDLGEGFQIVLQPDHGLVAGQLAAAWDFGPAVGDELRAALITAAARHDDGWSVWERHPRVDERGRPQNFIDVPLEGMLSTYSACAEVVGAENPLAGLLVSMHVSGLRRGRYGVFPSQPETALQELRGPVRTFVEAEERRQHALAAALGVTRPLWAYRLLQVLDVFSLHLGMELGERSTIDAPPPPLVPEGAPAASGQALRLQPTGVPWQVACEPYPFRADALIVRMDRRVLPRREFSDDGALRAAFHAAEAETVELSLVPLNHRSGR